jgi:hypothetical protein
MPFVLFHILWISFRGILSVAIVAGAIYLLTRWFEESRPVGGNHDLGLARTRPSKSSAFTVAAPSAVLSKMHQTADDCAASVNILARVPMYSAEYSE